MDWIFALIKRQYPGMVFTYMDNILIATGNDITLHRYIVDEVHDFLAEESLFYKLSKCHFEQTSITYLEIVMEARTIHIDPTKLNSLLAWPQKLTLIKQVCLTLSVFEYHQAFIPRYVNIVQPINNLLKKDILFKWMEEHTNAMDQLAHAVTVNPIL